MMRKGLGLFVLLSILACTKENRTIEVSAEDLHASVDMVTEVMIHDIFSPPVASRIYVYPNIAAYEIMATQNDDYNSLAGQVRDLEPIPVATDENVNHSLAAMIAHMDMSRRLVFSEDKMKVLRDSLYSRWGKANEAVFEASKTYGLEVAEHISAWMNEDNYNQTRTMPKFTLNTDDPSRWQPTPPAYMDGIEPHWNKIRPFVIDSAGQFKPTPPPPFSMEEGSDF